MIALAAAAVLIGVTGAWSPCGLSMVETIGPTGHTGGMPTTVAALLTFVPGCLIGGAVTFGGLAWIGSLLHAAGDVAYLVAAAIAVAAALAEIRGLPIRPQIRRQLPEHWRRVMPMPLASALYGALLGLGFTTFILSFGVWALAGISLALADLKAGLVIGAGFGLGRALPVLVLAPQIKRPSGRRATELMTQNPVLYRGFRAGDAAALGLVAAALLTAGTSAVADRTPSDSYRGKGVRVAVGAGDPSWSGGDLVAQKANGAAARAAAGHLGRGGLLRRNGRMRALPGGVPALGGPFLALRRGDDIALLDRRDLSELARVQAPHTDAIAVSGRWLAERVHQQGRDRLQVRSIERMEPRQEEGPGADTGSGSLSLGPPRVIARASAPAQIGRPSLDGDSLLFTSSTPARSRLRHYSLKSGSTRTLLAGRLSTYTNPSLLRNRFAYVRTTRQRQEIRLRALSGRGLGRILHYRPATSRRDPDHGRNRRRIPTRDLPPRLDRDPWAIWTLALAPKAVYATLTRPHGGEPRARILRFRR